MGEQIIIGIPGNWHSRTEIVTAIAKQSNGLILAGMMLLDTQTKDSYQLEVYQHDLDLHMAFEIASQGSMSQQEIAAISNHCHILYVLSLDVSVETAKKMLKVGVALLNSGGLAVKIESTGIAYSGGRWQETSASNDLRALYATFVTLVRGNSCFYSCGMHNFGLPDCRVDSLSPEDAQYVMNSFNYYLLSSPILEDNHTFSPDGTSQRFHLKKVEAMFYEADDPLHNPFGVWQLS